MLYILFIVLFILNLILLTLIAKRINLMDFPNNRKIHNEPTPVIGGLVIFLNLFIFSFFYQSQFEIKLIFYISIIIFFIGFLDDIFQVNISVRFFFQFFATSILIGLGLQITDIGGYSYINTIELGYFGIFLTFFSVLCLVNAINFIDGINGLSSGILTIALLSLLFFTYTEGKIIKDTFLYLLIISCFCFFIVNTGLSPFKIIFLGDSGSTSLAFILSFLLIFYTIPENRLIHPVLAIWCIALPMFELLNVIIKRLRKKINIFKPDKRHIHHILLNHQYTSNTILFALLSLSLLLNLLGFLIYKFFGPGPSLLSFVILFIIYYLITENFYKKISDEKLY